MKYSELSTKIADQVYPLVSDNLAQTEREIYELRKLILFLKDHAEFEDEVLDMIDDVIERRADFYADIRPA
jgi:hypothetical protein